MSLAFMIGVELLKQAADPSRDIIDEVPERALSDEEEEELEVAKSRLSPKARNSGSNSSMVDRLASPLKRGLLFGGLSGLAGAGIGAALPSLQRRGPKVSPAAGAIALGLLSGLPVGLATFLAQHGRNDINEKLIRRLPPGATEGAMWEASPADKS